MKVAAPLHPLLDRLEEAIIRRVRGGEFLPVARRAGQVRQTFLLGLGALRVVSRIAIGDQGARKVRPQQFARDFSGAGRVELKVDVLFRGVYPMIGPLSVEGPIGFICVHGAVTGGDLLADVVGHRLGVGCEQLLKADQGRGTEAKLEQLGDRARDLAETDPDVIVQIDGDGAQSRSDPAAQDFALSRLLHPSSARSAAGPRMAEQGDVSAPRNEVFLKMLGRIVRRVDADHPTAVRTMRRGCHLDEGIVLSRRGAEPAGMAHRSTPLARHGLGRALRGCARGDTGLSLPIRGELGLPLKLEFEFQTLVLTFERLVLGYQLRGPFLRGVQLMLQPVEAVAARIGQTDQTPQRRTAQMRAMVQLRASVLVLGIKAEAHGRSSLNAGNLTNFLRPD